MKDLLPWLEFFYAAVSGDSVVQGIVVVSINPTNDELTEHLLNRCAHEAVERGMPWNPFNLTLMFKPI